MKVVLRKKNGLKKESYFYKKSEFYFDVLFKRLKESNFYKKLYQNENDFCLVLENKNLSLVLKESSLKTYWDLLGNKIDI